MPPRVTPANTSLPTPATAPRDGFQYNEWTLRLLPASMYGDVFCLVVAPADRTFPVSSKRTFSASRHSFGASLSTAARAFIPPEKSANIFSWGITSASLTTIDVFDSRRRVTFGINNILTDMPVRWKVAQN